jgi:hypothetical protein
MARYLLLVGGGVIVVLIVVAVLRQLFGEGLVTLLYIAALVVGGFIIFRNLKTNRKVADASPEVRAQALALTPEPGKAVLYVVRTQFLGKAVGVNVQVDGVEVAQIKSPRFTRILLKPGPHRLTGYTGGAKAPAEGSGADVLAEAGGILFMLCEVEPQMVGAIIKFRPLPPEKARADLQKARMVVPDVAEV